jgi:hypothetical protein
LGRSTIAIAVVLGCAMLYLVTDGMRALPVFVVVLVTLVLWICGKPGRPAGFALAGFVVVSLIPIDVRPRHWIGTPRVVPVVMGFPSREAFAAARRGEIWLGGCIVSGFEPWWVVTW